MEEAGRLGGTRIEIWQPDQYEGIPDKQIARFVERRTYREFDYSADGSFESSRKEQQAGPASRVNHFQEMQEG